MTTITPHTAFDPPALAHLGMRPELVVAPVSDERVWLEIEPLVWLRPLFFDMNTGAHGEVLRVRKGGVLSRHKHPSPVHGFVIKGEWHYLEHTWTAVEGAYVFEPPGEVHSLTVDGDCEEMQTVFFIQGPIVNIDENDQVVGVEDNIDLIERLRSAYEANGLGADFVNQFIR